MASLSKIEWCDATFNPWIGCTKVSPACDHCYAAVSTPARALGVEWGAGQQRRRTSEGNWKQPLRWNARPFWQCEACGWRGDDRPELQSYCPGCAVGVVVPARRRVFCSSLADVFDNEVDPKWRRDLFDLIRQTPNLDWLLLTKRIGNVQNMVLEQRMKYAMHEAAWHFANDWENGKPPANVWLGATICNQAEADRDIPKLLATPAAVRFLSMEPLLGPVNIASYLHAGQWHADGSQTTRGIVPGADRRVDWVIVGGESGHSARPMHPSWADSLRTQCARACVPFLFKQWGEWGPMHQPIDSEGPIAGYGINGDWPMLVDLADPHGGLIRCGKKNAGRLLYGVEHNGYPVPRHA